MKIKSISLTLSIKIIILFITMIFLSFIPEYLHDFFGDWQCIGKCDYSTPGLYHSNTLHWGYRHWLWCFMCIILFIIQFISIFESSTENN